MIDKLDRNKATNWMLMVAQLIVKESLTNENIQHGFKPSRLYPWNPTKYIQLATNNFTAKDEHEIGIRCADISISSVSNKMSINSHPDENLASTKTRTPTNYACNGGKVADESSKCKRQAVKLAVDNLLKHQRTKASTLVYGTSRAFDKKTKKQLKIVKHRNAV